MIAKVPLKSAHLLLEQPCMSQAQIITFAHYTKEVAMPKITKTFKSWLQGMMRPSWAWPWHEGPSYCAEVVHELSSCLARTAEQQQLLADAARLLIRGEVSALPCPAFS